MEILTTNFKELGLVALTTPVCALLILVEMYFSNRHEKPVYTWRDTFTNVYLTVCQMGIDALTRRIPTYFALDYVYRHKLMQIESPVWYWVWLMIGQDFCFYWIHRLEHTCRFFWAVHVTHHSSEQFNFSVGFRSSVLEPIYRFVFYLPLPLLGFEAKDLFLAFSITQIYGILVHTHAVRNIPVYEWLFVTPSHHRVHHASNVRYLDKNIGMLLIIWDKMFGTYEEELDDEPIHYGLIKPADNQGWFKVIFHEYIAIWQDVFVNYKDLPWNQRIGYVFGPPGWSHDGSRKTSRQLQEELAKNEPAMPEYLDEPVLQ